MYLRVERVGAQVCRRRRQWMSSNVGGVFTNDLYIPLSYHDGTYIFIEKEILKSM